MAPGWGSGGEGMSGLFGSAILEVALGLFLLYLLLSIICSSIQEMLAALLKLRSRDLVRGIANLVCDPAVFAAVMEHPTILAVGNTNAETNIVRALAGRQAGSPSYISGRAFALALLDSVAPVRDTPSTIHAVREQALRLIKIAERTATGSAPTAGGAVGTLPTTSGGVALTSLPVVFDKVRQSIQTQFDQVPRSNEKEKVLQKLRTADLDQAVRDALKLAATHPVRRAVVAGLEENLGRELYQWALPMSEDDVVRRTIVGSVEGKQRLGVFLLNVIDRQVQRDGNVDLLARFNVLLAELPPDSARQAVEKALATGVSLDEIRAAVERNVAPAAASSLLSVIDAAQTEFVRLSSAIESWYDEAMEHVTGVYKRRIKTWIFLIALVLSLASGADSLRFVGTLYASPALRDVLVREAEAVIAATPTPTPVDVQATPGPAAGERPISASFQNAQQAARQLSQVNQLFGFDDHPTSAFPPASSDDIVNWLLWLLKRVFGVLITAFALSLGAPFWFDVLQKIVNLRATGTKSKTSEAESK